MDFVSSAILGGMLWDAVKMGGPLTLDFVKEKVQGYLVDDAMVLRLENLKRRVPISALDSQNAIQTYIENDQEWKLLRQEIQPITSVTINNNGNTKVAMQNSTNNGTQTFNF